MTIYSKKSERRRAIRTLVDAAHYLLRRTVTRSPLGVKISGDLGLSDFLAYVILIQAAQKLGYRGPLLQLDKVR